MENIERDIPKPFEVYRHFKGNLYQILNIAVHSETRETLVIYQALYEDFGIYARPLSMFLSEIDRVKYPEVKDKYMFTKIRVSANTDIVNSISQTTPAAKIEYPVQLEISKTSNQVTTSIPSVSQAENDSKGRAEALFIEFLDEDDFIKKRNILKAISGIATDSMINNMAASLDLVVSGNSRDQDIRMIDDYIRARIHFDGVRLRN